MSDTTNWDVLNVRTLRESTKAVLDVDLTKKTLRSAYAEALEALKASGRDLQFLCQHCRSVIDDEMSRCWACGLVFDDGTEEAVSTAALEDRAAELGVDVPAADREALVEAIEVVETKKRAATKARKGGEIAELDSRHLNEKITESMPDGWRKNPSKLYVAYFDSSGKRRIAVFTRGLRVDFSVDDGALDGLPDLEFVDAENRRRRHFGRSNYVFSGDSSKVALEIVKTVFERYP